jgi:predicted site-specific integrase-resolvase
MLLTKSEAAKFLGIAIRTLDDWRAAGSIACIQRPNFVRFLVSDLEAFIQRHRQPERVHRTLRRRTRLPRVEQKAEQIAEGPLE